jgi:hypothetical protein
VCVCVCVCVCECVCVCVFVYVSDNYPRSPVIELWVEWITLVSRLLLLSAKLSTADLNFLLNLYHVFTVTSE